VGRKWAMTSGEEAANCLSHGLMAAVAMIALPYVAVRGYIDNGYIGAWTKSAFIMGIFLMFLASAIYHAMPQGSGAKSVCHALDHISIFVAIAASYTPLAILVVGGRFGWSVLAVQWGLVIYGAVTKLMSIKKGQKASLLIYLLMGWMAVIMLPSIVRNASWGLLAWIIAGGLFYTIGSVIYALKGFRYHHLIWHILIILGAGSHFVAIVYNM